LEKPGRWPGFFIVRQVPDSGRPADFQKRRQSDWIDFALRTLACEGFDEADVLARKLGVSDDSPGQARQWKTRRRIDRSQCALSARAL
jgi:hypothetical protein